MGRIEIELGDGSRVRVDDGVSPGDVAPGDRGSAGMIAPPPGVRIWLAAGVTDMRCGFDGLAAMVQHKLARDPYICVERDYVAASPRGA